MDRKGDVMKKTIKCNQYIHSFRIHVPNLLNETFVNACRPAALAALKIPLNQFKRYVSTLVGHRICHFRNIDY